jgi:hypothetical protein
MSILDLDFLNPEDSPIFSQDNKKIKNKGGRPISSIWEDINKNLLVLGNLVPLVNILQVNGNVARLQNLRNILPIIVQKLL